MRTETLSDEQAVRGARIAAEKIEEDCLDRRTIKWGFQGLDLEIREEILATWTEIIVKAVVAWEAEQGQSAKVEPVMRYKPYNPPYGERGHDAILGHEAWVKARDYDLLLAERDQLLAENARLTGVLNSFTEVKRG